MNDNSDKDKELLKIAESISKDQIENNQFESLSDDELAGAFEIISKVKSSFQRSNANFDEVVTIETGETWGHLRVEEKIGSGGMGLVYQAYDNILDRQVAVKFLNPKSSQYISSNNFIKEARRLAKVRHPNVLAVYGANTFQNVTGFWSELLSGQTLEDLVKKNLNQQQILDIAKDLASAVKEVHDNNIIHGDIKPQNIMLSEEGRVVLMDFGSGSDLNFEDFNISSSTPIIMAPELFRGHPKTKASDIYALGVVYYFLSTKGEYPYKSHSLEELRKQILLRKPIDYKNLSGRKKWKQLIKNMLCYNPEDSPTIDEVIDDIEFIDNIPKKKKKRFTIISILSLLICVIVVLIYSNLKLDKANKSTRQALSETSEINDLMFNMLSSVSPGVKGKDVLMVDVLDDLISETKSNEKISNGTKAKTVYTLAYSLKNLKYIDKGSALLDEILTYPELNDLLRVQILYGKAIFVMRKNIDKESNIKAREYLSQASEIYSSKKISEPSVFARLEYSWALLLDRENDNEAAIHHLENSLKYWNSQLPSLNVNREKGLIYMLLGNLYSAKSQFDDSMEYYSLAEQNFESFAQKTNNNLLAVKNNMAQTLAQTGDTQQALKIYQELVRIGEEYLGQSHPDFIVFKLNLANAYYENNKPNDSIKELDEVMQVTIDYFGKESVAYLYSQSVYASSLKLLKQFSEAERIFQKIIQISKKILGQSNPQTLTHQYNLIELYVDSENPHKALKLIEEIRDIAYENLNPDNLIILELEEAKAWSDFLIGNYQIAETEMVDVISHKTKVFGKDSEKLTLPNERLKQIRKRIKSGN